MTNTAPSALEPGLPLIVGATLLTLLVIYGVGRLLLPGHVGPGNKLWRLAGVLTSGLLFVSGATALVVLQRFSYLALIPLAQIVAAGWWQWQGWRRRDLRAAPAETWSWSELAMLAAITAGAAVLFHVPYYRTLQNGDVIEMHGDLGYFVQHVIGLPEARVANLWAPTLAAHAFEATGGRDLWYHWGSMFLAVAIRAATGLPAINALMDVTCSVLNVILVIVAGGVLSTFVRLPVSRLLVLAAASVVATQVMKLPGLLWWFREHFPFGDFQHSKVSLALFFAYKYEAIAVLAALGAWLVQARWLAVLLLFSAGVSAPHTVAAGGVTAAVLGVVGLLMRNPRMARTAAAAMATLLLAWALTTWLGGAQMAGGKGGGLLSLKLSDLGVAAGKGAADLGISLVLSALSLPGIIHLIRARDAAATESTRIVGWMAISGLAGSCGAFHLLHRMPDGFHVMLFVQTVLVMPAGIWGLVRMAVVYQGRARIAAMALIALGSVMGVHDLILPLFSLGKAPWHSRDVAAMQQVLQGQPFGYYATYDRGWWISKYSSLASMLDSRCVRLNAAPGEKQAASSRFYGYTQPFQVVPPAKKELANDWSLRFAQRLGVKFVLETTEDPLPAAIRPRVEPVLSAGELRLFRFKGDSGSVGLEGGAGE